MLGRKFLIFEKFNQNLCFDFINIDNIPYQQYQSISDIQLDHVARLIFIFLLLRFAIFQTFFILLFNPYLPF